MNEALLCLPFSLLVLLAQLLQQLHFQLVVSQLPTACFKMLFERITSGFTGRLFALMFSVLHFLATKLRTIDLLGPIKVKCDWSIRADGTKIVLVARVRRRHFSAEPSDSRKYVCVRRLLLDTQTKSMESICYTCTK